MQIPDHLHQHVGQVLEADLDTAIRRGLWAVVYGLIPIPDGNKWCVLLGEHVGIGISGFGDTPEEAIFDFEKQMRTARSPQTVNKWSAIDRITRRLETCKVNDAPVGSINAIHNEALDLAITIIDEEFTK